MYIRPSSLRNKRSEDQLISELIDVFKRHNIKCGGPQDLAHLGSDLVSHDEFRNDLFSRCNVISHMSQAGLSPEQLLVITAQALGGPGIIKPDGTVEIPHITRSAFLIGYEIWIKEGDEEESGQTSVTRQAFSTPSLAPRSEPDHRGANGSHNGSGADTHQPGPVSPSTPLDSLTLNQLKRYIEDIEGRINRIEPHLGQIPPRSNSTSELMDRLRFIESQNGHAPQMIPSPFAGTAPLQDFNGSTAGPESLQNRGVVQRKVLPSIGPLATPAPAAPVVIAPAAATAPFQSAPSITPATSPLYRLRVAIGALSFLLILAIVSSAILAYRNLHPETNLAYEANPTSASPAQPATQLTPPYSASAATALSPIAPTRSVPSPSTPAPAPVKSPPANTSDTRSAAKSQQTPSPASSTVARPALQPPARSNSQPPARSDSQAPARSNSQQSSPAPAQSPQTAAAPPANSNPAPPPPAPVVQTPPPATVVASSARPEQPREEPAARVATPPPATSTPVAASKPPDTPVAAPVTRPTPPPGGPVSVPSATMMRYAVAMPPPVFPKNRFSRPDDIVVVQATISPNGAVTGARTLSGPPDLRPAVTQAMQAWRFKPYVVDGNPVEVVTTFNFAFKSK